MRVALDPGRQPKPAKFSLHRDRPSKLTKRLLLEDACGAAGIQSVECGRGYTCQFVYFRARWRESPFTHPGQNCSLPLAVSWARGRLSATLREP